MYQHSGIKLCKSLRFTTYTTISFIYKPAVDTARRVPRKKYKMEEFLGKKYKLISSDKFEDYMKFIGVGLLYRKAAMSVSPVTVLTKNDDGSYTLTMSTPIKSTKITFVLGEEFEEERADNTKVKSVMTIEGNKLIQTHIEENGKKSQHVREFTADSLTVTTTADGWDDKCVRKYELVK